MRRLAIALVVVLAGLAAFGLWKRAEIARLHAVLTLFEPDRVVANFGAMDAAFVTVPLPADGPPSPLPPGPAMTLPPGTEDWLAARSTTALVVLKDGRILHESYRQGTGPDDRRISWSVAKSFLSALYGILEAEGAMPPRDTPVTEVVPALRGTGYEGVTVHHILTMTSGVAFNEDYLDFWSDINRMGRTLALGQRMDDFAASLQDRAAPPGKRWHYVSIDTHVLGMVIRAATGKPVAELMQQRLLAPLGLERDAYFIADGTGEPFVLGGLNLTARDYARFGQMVLEDGRGIVPAGWLAESTRRQAPLPAEAMGYGYQWWVPPGQDGTEVMAQGIYGQFIWIDRARGVVIVRNAADLKFKEPGVEDENIRHFRAIAAAAAAAAG
jgi:hypothetical protein